MTPIVVGVDPGGSWTGIVVRRGGDAVWVDACHRGPSMTDAAWFGYLRQVLDAAVAEARSLAGGAGLVAVEDVVAPNPHVRVTNVGALLATAKVVGMVLTLHPSAVLVRPGGHGSAPLSSYPPNLVGGRERAGAGRLKHARSAYDVAGAGLVQWRLDTTTVATGGRL